MSNPKIKTFNNFRKTLSLLVRDSGEGTGKWRTNPSGSRAYQRTIRASDGKQIYATAKTVTRANANLKTKLEQYEERLRIQRTSGDAPTRLREFAEFDTQLKLDQNVIRDSTAKKYRRAANLLFSWKIAGKFLGDYELSELTPIVLEQVTARAVKTLPAGEPCRTTLSYLKTLINRAVELDILQKAPRGIKLPKRIFLTYPPPSADEFKAVLELAIKADDKPVIAMLSLLWQGLRWSEALGVTLERIEGNVITINRQLRRPADSGRLALAPLKSDKSYRTLTVSDSTMRLIFAAIDLVTEVDVIQVDESGRSSKVRATFLVPGKRGLPSPNYLRKRIQGFAKEAGITQFKMHDLRSTALVDSVQAGESISAVAATLGHTPEVALKSYMRLRPESIASTSLNRSSSLDKLLAE